MGNYIIALQIYAQYFPWTASGEVKRCKESTFRYAISIDYFIYCAPSIGDKISWTTAYNGLKIRGSSMYKVLRYSE